MILAYSSFDLTNVLYAVSCTVFDERKRWHLMYSSILHSRDTVLLIWSFQVRSSANATLRHLYDLTFSIECIFYKVGRGDNLREIFVGLWSFSRSLACTHNPCAVQPHMRSPEKKSLINCFIRLLTYYAWHRSHKNSEHIIPYLLPKNGASSFPLQR